METSVITSRGQIVIPGNIRRKYDFKPGSRIAFVETKAGVLIKPVEENYIDELVERVGKYFPSAKEYKAWKVG